MAYGLEVKNFANHFLLSTDYKHYAYLGRFSVAAIYPGNNYWAGIQDYMWHRAIWYTDIPAVRRPIVLLDLPQNTLGTNRVQAGLGILSVSQLNAGTWRVYIVATAGYVPAAGCVVAFAHASDLAVYEQFGLRLYNADGGLAYDSSRKPLLIAGGQAGYSVAMRHFFCTEVGATGQGIQTIFPAGVSGRLGAYFTGSAAIIYNHGSGTWNTNTRTASAQVLNVFSYYNNSVFCNWSPVLMNTDIVYPSNWDGLNKYGTFMTDGTYWWTQRQGTRGAPHSQKTIIADPAFY